MCKHFQKVRFLINLYEIVQIVMNVTNYAYKLTAMGRFEQRIVVSNKDEIFPIYISCCVTVYFMSNYI